MGEHLPKEVREKLEQGDFKALSRMGRKGAEHSAQSRAFQKAARDEELAKLALEQARLYRVTEEGDILPPDPNIPQSPDE
jgi:hypothetical protein